MRISGGLYSAVVSKNDVILRRCGIGLLMRTVGGGWQNFSLCLEALIRPFKRRGSAVKHVQSCLSARKGRESSFQHCGGLMKLVSTCVCTGKT